MASITITLGICVGLNEKAIDESLTLFPNPNDGNFVISSRSVADIVIFDALGKRVFECSLNSGNNFTKKISGMSPGVYFVVLDMNGNSGTRKLLVE
jgi:hypothetical protein